MHCATTTTTKKNISSRESALADEKKSFSFHSKYKVHLLRVTHDNELVLDSAASSCAHCDPPPTGNKKESDVGFLAATTGRVWR